MARITAIGGGHGLARVLAACRRLGVAPTAVVTVADDGGSSGRLRRDLGIIALGDLRMALLALAEDRALADLLSHRFVRGDLEGHALGNLVLLALSERAAGDATDDVDNGGRPDEAGGGDSVLAALRQAAALLRCQGTVLPSTTVPVQLSARIAGSVVHGQARITATSGAVDGVWLDPADPPACTASMEAVTTADIVVLGPGSLFTSVIANLLVPDLCRAVRDSSAQLVHVANVAAPPGESAELSITEHVARIETMLGGRALDAVITHDGPAPCGPGRPLRIGDGELAGHRVVAGDLLERDGDAGIGRAHDPDRLARALARVADDASVTGDGLPATAGSRAR